MFHSLKQKPPGWSQAISHRELCRVKLSEMLCRSPHRGCWRSWVANKDKAWVAQWDEVSDWHDFVSKLEDHCFRTQNFNGNIFGNRLTGSGVTIAPCSRTWHVGSGVRWPNVSAARLHLERPSAGWRAQDFQASTEWCVTKKTQALLGLDLSKSAIAAPIWLAACMYSTGYAASGKT